MAQASRPLIAAVVAAFLLVAVYLLVVSPQPQAPSPPQPRTPDRSGTPLAPLDAIQRAEDVSAASDAANQQRQAAADQLDAP